MFLITPVTMTKVQNVIFLGREGVRRAEKQVCQLATLGIKGQEQTFFLQCSSLFLRPSNSILANKEFIYVAINRSCEFSIE